MSSTIHSISHHITTVKVGVSAPHRLEETHKVTQKGNKTNKTKSCIGENSVRQDHQREQRKHTCRYIRQWLPGRYLRHSVNDKTILTCVL